MSFRSGRDKAAPAPSRIRRIRRSGSGASGNLIDFPAVGLQNLGRLGGSLLDHIGDANKGIGLTADLFGGHIHFPVDHIAAHDHFAGPVANEFPQRNDAVGDAIRRFGDVQQPLFEGPDQTVRPFGRGVERRDAASQGPRRAGDADNGPLAVLQQIAGSPGKPSLAPPTSFPASSEAFARSRTRLRSASATAEMPTTPTSDIFDRSEVWFCKSPSRFMKPFGRECGHVVEFLGSMGQIVANTVNLAQTRSAKSSKVSAAWLNRSLTVRARSAVRSTVSSMEPDCSAKAPLTVSIPASTRSATSNRLRPLRPRLSDTDRARVSTSSAVFDNSFV